MSDSLTSKAIRPVLRAYALGYLTTASPRLLGYLRVVTRRDLTKDTKIDILYKILKTPLEFNRFPAACAVIVGGSTIVPQLLYTILRSLLILIKRPWKLQPSSLSRLRFICTFVSAWLAFDLLNCSKGWARRRAQSRGALPPFHSSSDHPNQHHLPPADFHMAYAGKTLDFTHFALCRALDVSVVTAWTRTRSRKAHPEHQVPTLASFARQIADPAVFAASAAVIMWSWFYSPYRLPKDYNHWISKAADIDPNLIQVLRLCRQGDFIYGIDTGHGNHLTELCKKLDLPEEWGNPAVTVPLPCTLYHSGVGKSCELHAGSRFWRSWGFSMRIYLPLQLLSILRRPSSITANRLLHLFLAAARSSTFLGAFVSLFYYAVCLARTRLGPKLFSSTTITPQMWDGGLCVLAGCMACGWSIFLEAPSKRQEIAFFVAPRALATIVPRVYDKRYQKREQIVFATSVAIVLNAVQNQANQHVRGVFGRILKKVLTA